jgi:glycerol-3-phosphate dehydrogenase
MSEGVWIAIIGAFATIVAATIAAWSARSRAPVKDQDPPPPDSEETVASSTPAVTDSPVLQDEGSFPLVQSREEIVANLHRLEEYLDSTSNEERDFARELLRKARCVVLARRNGQLLIGSSRFVGYAMMTRERFNAHINKDGRETNVAISQLLGSGPVEDSALEAEYQAFCQQHAIQPSGHSRKYWRHIS